MYRILYKFCSQIQNKKDEVVQGYNYAKNKIKIINDPKFIQKTIKQEHLQRPQPYHLSSLQFPVLLCSSVLFLYHLWQVMPYSKIFQHTSISDQTEKLIYPMMLSPITLQNHKQLLLYFPFLIYGLFLNGKYMNTKGLVGLYFLNSIICSGFTYYYQKESSKQQGLDMIIPKTIGACTPLAYVASFIAINPKHLMFVKSPSQYQEDYCQSMKQRNISFMKMRLVDPHTQVHLSLVPFTDQHLREYVQKIYIFDNIKMNSKESQFRTYNLIHQLYYYCINTQQRAGQIAQYYQNPQTGGLDIYQFSSMLQQLLPQSQKIAHNDLFNFLTNKYQTNLVTGQQLDQILSNLDKQIQQQQCQQHQQQNQKSLQQPQLQQQQQQQQKQQQQQPKQEVQLQQRPRTPQKVTSSETRNNSELISEFIQKLEDNKIKVEDVFKKFDKNKDNQMSIQEFQEMFSIVIKNINKVELNQLVEAIFQDKQQLTLFQLIKLSKNQLSKNILESNIYENPANLLSSNIKFDEYYAPDMSVIAIKEFIDKFNQLKQSNQKYQDSIFPPNERSLGTKLRQYTWQRAPENSKFFAKDNYHNRFGLGKWISPHDIQQGELGDCYFLASISALGNRRPDLLLDNFVTRTTNRQGIYCVKLCIDGGWKAITIDDYFPMKYSKPAFTRGRNNELWVMVLEKAWAKIFGSYSQIESGYPREVLRTLTGAPTKVLFTNSEKFESELESCVNQRCIMVCATIKKDVLKSWGLVPGHAYSLLKIKEITHQQQKKKLLKIRNPWGKEEWKGDWSDQSKLWTKELREELKLTSEDDGVFYMEMSSFKSFFDDVQVCFVKDHYFYSNIYDKSDNKHSQHYQIDIPRDGLYYLSVCQKNKRFENSNEYSIVKLLIADSHLKGIAWEQGAQNELWCQAKLNPGKYYVQVHTSWEFSKNDQFNLSVYGPGQAQIKKIQKIQNFIQNILIQYARTSEKLKPCSTYPEILKSYEFLISMGYGYYYASNTSNRCFQSNLNLKMNGLRLKKPHSGNQVEIQLKPKQEFLAIFRVGNTGYKFQIEESFCWK